MSTRKHKNTANRFEAKNIFREEAAGIPQALPRGPLPCPRETLAVMGTAYPTFLEITSFMKMSDSRAVTMFNNFHQFCRKDSLLLNFLKQLLPDKRVSN